MIKVRPRGNRKQKNSSENYSAKIASLKRLSWEIPIETDHKKWEKTQSYTSKIKEGLQLEILQNKGIMREYYKQPLLLSLKT